LKVDTMRKIDYYAGIPLCFIGTILIKLKKLLFGQRTTKIKKVLFVELSEMGSTILVDPAMKKLQRELDVNLYFVIFKKNKTSLDLLKTVPEKNIFTIREDSFVNIVIDTLSFLYWTRKNKIDTVIDLELFSRFTALITGFLGAQRVVGFYSFFNEGLYRGDFLNYKVSYNSHIHIAKNFMALVNSIIDSNGEVPYSKRVVTDDEIKLDKAVVTKYDKQNMKLLIKKHYEKYDPETHKIILINPNASELLVQRRWPTEYYSELIKKILEKNEKILIFITGANVEKEEAEA